MKPSILKTLAFALLVLHIGCSSENSNGGATNTEANEPTTTTAAVDYNKLSIAFCECAQSLIALNKEMEALHREDKNEEFMKMAPKVGEQFKATMGCCREARKGQDSGALDEEKMVAALAGACPDIPERMAVQMAKQL